MTAETDTNDTQNDPQTATKSVFQTGMDELRTLRDQVRLKLHLAGQEAREQWETKFEPRIEKLEQQIREAGDNTREAIRGGIDQAREAFQGFRDRLTGNGKSDDSNRGQNSIT